MSHAINVVFHAVSSAITTVTNAVGDVARAIGDPLTEWVMKNDQKNFTKVIENDQRIFNKVDGETKKLMEKYPWLKWVVIIVATYFTGFGGWSAGVEEGAVAAGDEAAFEFAMQDAAIETGAVELPAGTVVDGVTLQGGMSVPSSSISGAISTPTGTVVTTTEGAALGQTVNSGLAYKVATASSSAGWFSTAKNALDAVQTADKVQKIINTKTGITQTIAAGSKIPTGWTLDPNWNQTAYEGTQTRATPMAMNVTAPTDAGPKVPFVAALALLAGVLYFARKSA